ncbi:amino acid ABC transporter ATP-binding/permease protein [Listeria ilorinensis]|uniref:amino acid ABC transporter ATP-binding/permease protein n=1 Tax=Listeria ilorinensis TaxID=2867439 RepID=UPI001EF5F00C|nr:ABC transporter ATP-binding protein [Listeria ilorinensis]
MKKGPMLKWLIRFLKPFWFKMTLAILLGIISNLSVVLIPLIGIQQLLLILQGNHDTLSQAFWQLLSCGIIRGLARYGEQYLNHDIAFRLLASVRNQIFDTLRKLGPAKLSGKKSGELVTAITSDVEALEVFFAHTVSPIFIAFGTTTATVLYLATFDWRLALILLAGQISVGVVVPILSYRNYEKVGAVYAEHFAALNQQILENITSLQDISQFDLTEKRLQQMWQLGQTLNSQYQKKMNQNSFLQITSEAILLLTAVLMIGIGASTGSSAETLATSTILALSSFGSVFALNGLGNALLTTFASANRLFTLVTEKPPVIFRGEKTALSAPETATVTDLLFHYPTSMTPTLYHLSLDLKRNQIIGIGGKSGSGKSSLFKLLMRYYEPDQGNIAIAQDDLSIFSEQALHEMEGMMAQTTFIFEGTIAWNIALSDKNVDLTTIQQVAEKASIHDWILSLPEGYQTKIGTKNRLVSDGERQRLGLARLFFHNSPIFLLDEPTSNLDYLNEQAILQTIKKESTNKLTLLISHRASTLEIADRKYRMTNGHLSEY